MPASSRSPAVLLLTGDELTQRVSASCLETFGFTVVSTRRAGEAEKLLREQETGRKIDVLVTDTDVRDAIDGLSLGRVARLLNPKMHVIYTARFPHAIPVAKRVDGAPCLRTPYHGHQLAAVINGLRSSSAPDLKRHAA
ncbi:histidine kinase [Methylobacterium nodulans]|uniref:Response regulator receiver protein n=1 Tax=Methylobacterium nodulans (strain LMG 21967 / CNCM I-2342 / ORS 2060) TaxID=460265 RepID=B8IXU1_METNO|nr:histidine kinase [Methylobacterium nodulans]ACL63231.1 response regulator receiver protein [Methylobacterium nodulans ORS 2060]